MHQNQTTRSPRFKRVSGKTIYLQQRDIEILKSVFENRFLTSDQIHRLIHGSKQGILRRLNLLFHNGFLDRPREQIRPFGLAIGSMVYGLGKKGGILLSQEIGISQALNDWTTKNRNIKQINLHHALAVSNFMVCLDLACRNNGRYELVKPTIDRFNWKIKYRGRFLSVVPDKIFCLRLNKAPTHSKLFYYCLEADRSTMPVMRSDLFQSSIYRKMIVYWRSWREGMFQKHFGTNSLRVLFLTKSQERINSMIEANKKVDERKNGSRLFLFARSEQFSATIPDRVFDKVWQNGRDCTLVRLIS